MKLNNGYYKLNDEFINILHKNDALTREELVIITRFVNILDSYNIQIADNNLFEEYKNERDKINNAIPNSSAQSRAANRLAQYRLLNQIENKIRIIK